MEYLTFDYEFRPFDKTSYSSVICLIALPAAVHFLSRCLSMIDMHKSFGETNCVSAVPRYGVLGDTTQVPVVARQ